MASSVVKAATYLIDNKFVEAESRGHKIIVDTPPHLGGLDKGQLPGELLLSALGSCQALTAKGYAKKFNIDLQKFWVELEGEVDKDVESVVPRFQSIKSTFHIETSAPQEQIDAYTEFVETHCIIGETLLNTVNLSSKVVVNNPVK